MLVAGALAGILQSFIGGQPMLIMGVAQPIVLVYIFIFDFTRNRGTPYLPFCTWVCIWASLFMFLLAFFGTCKWITKFTRFSGELFGLLIAILFMK